MTKAWFAFIIMLCTCYRSVGENSLSIDFDISMQTEQHLTVINRYDNKKMLSIFRDLYNLNKRTYSTGGQRWRIPQIMHHVWFGIPFSSEFKQLRQTWIDKHPDWVFIFWTDDIRNDQDAYVVNSFEELNEQLQKHDCKRIVVNTRDLQFDNRKIFDASKSYGERSDILKWEIVYRYGGVYIDVDFECYKPLDRLHATYDFYTALQPLDTGRVQLGAALFAAYPGHPILERCVKDIKPGIGPIVMRTGPIHFTVCFIRQIASCSNYCIVFPASYFYPCAYEQRYMPKDVWYTSEAFGVHHWAGSWLKPEGFVS